MLTKPVWPNVVRANDTSYYDSMILVLRVSSDNLVCGIPFRPSVTYDCIIDWGDGSFTYATQNGKEYTHKYDTPGDYVVKLYGTVPSLDYGTFSTYRENLIELRQWGRTGLDVTVYRMFFSCVNMVVTATDIPDFSSVINVKQLFNGCTSITRIPNHESWSFQDGTEINQIFLGTKIPIMDCRNWGNVVIVNSAMSTRYCFSGMSNVTEILGLDGQDTTGAVDMAWTFNGCSALTRFPDVENWIIDSLTDATDMFLGATLPTWQYDQLLINWAAQSHQLNVPFHGGNSKYTPGGAAEAARNALITDGWTITDGGPV